MRMIIELAFGFWTPLDIISIEAMADHSLLVGVEASILQKKEGCEAVLKQLSEEI